MTLSYVSVCDGIGAAHVAWAPLGWRCAWTSEIAAFPAAVVEKRWGFPNLGDVLKIGEGDCERFGAVGVLVGGTPCQSFSVAGRRGGLGDPRGNLALRFFQLAGLLRPRWVVWENVPGVLSSGGGRDFGSILGAMVELGYGVAYRVLDAQYFGLAQRRKRVFAVGCLGDWRRAAAVLVERSGLRGDPAPGRETRADVANAVTASLGSGGPDDNDPQGGHLNAGGMGRRDYETETFVTHALRSEGFDASEDGTGRGTPIVPFDTTQITSKVNRCNPREGGPCHPLAKGAHAPAIAYTLHGSDDCASTATRSEVACSLRRKPPGTIENSSTTVVLQDVAFQDVGYAIPHQGNGGQPGTHAQGWNSNFVGTGPGGNYAVHRLTPRECERLQGFPDDYTLIDFKGKPASDGPRYAALGNSMAVPVMRWIGERIAASEARLQVGAEARTAVPA